MLKLQLPFHLTERTGGTFFRSSPSELRREKVSEVILEGLSIVIEMPGKIYTVSSDRPPQSDYSSPASSAIWPRWRWALTDEISVEQQMVLPARGNALAISWRLIGLTFVPVRLEARPVFSVSQPCPSNGFQIEPETDGSRLTWRPSDCSSKIIADTNGCLVEGTLTTESGLIPSTFQFELRPCPSVLIFSSESQNEAGVDPLIGGFLADLAVQRATTLVRHDPRNLVAA
ncbi:MAG: hypothetical protein WCE51_12970 [Chthoniobacterales bacterium]|jgi:hypothetical protein